jgi:hypothetical protein
VVHIARGHGAKLCQHSNAVHPTAVATYTAVGVAATFANDAAVEATAAHHVTAIEATAA